MEHQAINQMRTDESRTSSNENALHLVSGKPLDRRIDGGHQLGSLHHLLHLPVKRGLNGRIDFVMLQLLYIGSGERGWRRIRRSAATLHDKGDKHEQRYSSQQDDPHATCGITGRPHGRHGPRTQSRDRGEHSGEPNRLPHGAEQVVCCNSGVPARAQGFLPSLVQSVCHAGITTKSQVCQAQQHCGNTTCD